MKKITLLLLFFCSVLGYGQVETFEGGIPANWAVMAGANGLGATQQWKLNTTPPAIPQGGANGSLTAAYIDNWNIGQNNTEEDWLIMNQRTIPSDGQLRFFVRQLTSGNQNTFIEIRVSTNADQMNQGAYQTMAVLAEGQLNNLNGDINQYRENVIDFDAQYIGDQVYVAFVRVFTQPGLGRAGERFLIDNVNILSECNTPEALDVPIPTVGVTSAVLKWDNKSASPLYEIAVFAGDENPTLPPAAGYPYFYEGSFPVGPTPPTTSTRLVTGLPAGLTQQFFVRSKCTDPQGQFYYSDWEGPFFFTTLPLGSICSDPIVINTLPFQVAAANTSTYGDEVDTVQGATNCGAVPPGANYLQGNEVFYSYTPDLTGNINIIMTPGASSPNSSIFVYNGCNVIGTGCVGGMANSGSGARNITVGMIGGTTYTIVISSAAPTQSVNYSLLIQREDCQPKPEDLDAADFAVDGARLFWSAGGFSSWQVQVQPLGLGVPMGNGTDIVTTTSSFVKTGLDPATRYQYWVRAECSPGSGTYTPWAGPFAFNTLRCEPAAACTHTIRLTDSGNNGWNSNRIQIRQNGIIVETLGTQIATGSGPVNVPVQLCPGIPFDVYWLTVGTQSQQCGLSVLNSFGQTIYTKPAGAGTAGTVLFTEVVKCDVPRCDLTPTNVTVPVAGITTTTATVNWTAVATTSWEVYVVLSGSPAPTAETDGNTAATPIPDLNNPSLLLGGLTPDTAYDVYIRVNCSPNDSPWSAPATFTTLPTCFKPINPVVVAGSITMTGAKFSWDKGQPTDTLWEVLLVPVPDTTAPPMPAVNPDLSGGSILFTSTTNVNAEPPVALTPATIYYVYVRTVCPGDDKSVWAQATVATNRYFNTITCLDADKCNYKFVLTNTSGNSWNGARMQVRQNGIVIQTIGTTGVNNANGITVALCPGLNYDLFWSVPGTAPANIGVSVQNPFLDVLFTMLPGTATPLNVVYTSTVNCTPAPCSKPTLMTATGITHNSAILGWTDNSTPPSSLYDLYVVPTGGAAPINDPATTPTIAGVPDDYTITTLDGTVPLQPSTSYTYYVRAVCGPGITSTWTILTPTTFVTKPVNDECINAFPVTINTGQDCLPANNVRGTTLGATASLPAATAGPGCGTTDDDVWFSFVATHTSHSINFNNIVATPTTLKINHSVFSGACDNLTKLYCSTTTTSQATGLVIGETYYIRVYTPGTNLAQFAAFDVCITSPPANNECDTAMVVPTNPTRVCAQSVTGNTLGATASLPPTTAGTGCGNADDDIWFQFQATSTIHLITFSDIVGSTTDINHTLYQGNDCATMLKLYCSNRDVSIANNLIIGEIYKIRVYTNGSNTTQSAIFKLCITTPPPIQNDECATAIAVPVNNNPDFNCLESLQGSITGATASAESSTCAGNENDDVWYTFTAGGSTELISFSNVQGTSTDLVHSLYSGSVCGGLTLKYCSDDDESMAENLIAGQVYTIRVWSFSTILEDITYDVCIRTIPAIMSNTNQFTVEQLVREVLVDSECAQVTNITSSTGTNFGSVNGIGYFEKAQSNFPLERGVILSTGNAANAKGPNLVVMSEGPFTGWPGDANLDALNDAIVEGENLGTKNATKLEFDFVPLIDEISFNFIFASEEYGTFQCGFSDAFAFLLTDTVTGITTNLAVIPDTTIPVSVITIHDDAYNGDCIDANEGYFGAYYDEDGPINPLAAPINFNGMTIKMQAKSPSVPGRLYHIKLVIADYSDNQYDSAVFLEKFKIEDVDLGPDLTVEDGNAPCPGDDYLLDSQIENPELYTFEWFFNDNTEPIPNAISPTLLIDEPGVYTIKAYNPFSICPYSDSITVEYHQDLPPGQPDGLIKCNAAGTDTFNLRETEETILAPYTVLHEVSYYLTPEEAEEGNPEDALPTPEEYLGSDDQTIYARVVNTVTGCHQVISFGLRVQDLTPQFTLSGVENICPEDSTVVRVEPTNNNFDPNSASVTYEWSDSTGIIATTRSITIEGGNYGAYSVTVNNSGCESEQNFTISNSNIIWNIDITPSSPDLCPDENGTLTVVVTNNIENSPVDYTFTLPDMTTVENQSGILNIDSPGVYSVLIDILGCTAEKSITIEEGEADWDVTFVGAPYIICENQSTDIAFTTEDFDINDPDATYTWTRPDGSQFSGQTIVADQVGEYTLTVDILGCFTDFVATVTENTSSVSISFESGCENDVYVLRALPVNNSFDPLTSTFSWSGPGVLPTVPASPDAIVLGSNGLYNVRVTTADGCYTDLPFDAQTLALGCKIMKGISPNNDQKNDKFDLSAYNVKRLSIFNRYGTEVFKYDNYTDQWIGQSNSGEELPDGTYFYVFDKADGKSENGWIYINR